MRIKFVNNDHDKISLAVRSGSSNSNFGLLRGESHEMDFVEPVLLAWWPKNNAITQAQLDIHGSMWNEDADITFGNPLGRVE